MKYLRRMLVLLVLSMMTCTAFAFESSMEYFPGRGLLTIRCSGLSSNTSAALMLLKSDGYSVPELSRSNLVLIKDVSLLYSGTEIAIYNESLPECTALLGGVFIEERSPVVLGHVDPPSLDIMEMPASLNVIGEEAFMNGTFHYFHIGKTTHTIGARAFKNCKELREIVIPSSVTSIASDAFDGCDNLTITCDSNSTAYQYAVDHGIDYLIMPQTLVVVPGIGG